MIVDCPTNNKHLLFYGMECIPNLWRIYACSPRENDRLGPN